MSHEKQLSKIPIVSDQRSQTMIVIVRNKNNNQPSNPQEFSQQPLYLCEICNEKCQKLYKLCLCSHQYCQKCLILYIKQKVSSYQKIRCCDYQCSKTIQLNQQNSKYIYQKLDYYLQNVVSQLTFTFQELQKIKCKICLLPSIINLQIDDMPKFYCKNCKQFVCSRCLTPQHLNKPCNISKIQLPYGFKQCSRCLTIIEKNKGCDHITCLCKYNFCYDCQEQWHQPHVCVKKIVIREGLSYFMCLVIKILLLPLLAFVILVEGSLMISAICFLSGILLGLFVWFSVLQILIIQKEENYLQTALKFIAFILIFLLIPMFLVIFFIPGLLIPFLNICWKQKILFHQNILLDLFENLRGQTLQYIQR